VRVLLPRKQTCRTNDEAKRPRWKRRFRVLRGLSKATYDSGIQLYKLTYSVKLSGGKVPAGVILITVLDHPSQPGIVGFFINGVSR